MHLIPLDVDYHDGCVVLTILYDIGWLRSYYRQRKEREQNPEQKFNFRLFDIEYQFQHNIKTDSFGRITYLRVPFVDEERDDDELFYYDLPSSVSHLRKLKKIQISGCQQIPVEPGALPRLTKIKFFVCERNLFDNIPVGLQLPHNITCVRLESSQFPNSLIPFLNVFITNCLKKLCFNECVDPNESNTLISALQSCKLKSYQSLMTLYFETAELDNNAFEKLLCEVLLWFPNLQNLILKRCDINSLRGAEKRIKDLGFVSNINLSKLDLYCNPVFFKRLIVSSECEFVTTKLKEIDSRTLSDEKSAVLLLLNAFNTISNLGVSLVGRRSV